MTSVINILFRGLLVFHQIAGQNGLPAFQVGMLPEKGHYARIITHTSDGDKEQCLFPEPQKTQADCYFTKVPETQQPLSLVITNLESPGGIVLRTIPPDGQEEIDRHTHAAKDDFRWILDLESPKFHNKIEGQLDMSKLKVVMTIPEGTFYAAQLSDPLIRHSTIKGNEDFGSFAGLIGCEIRVTGGKAQLVGADPSSPIFTFDSTPGVTYEISNAPPTTETRHEDHFHLYYDLFKRKPIERFSFIDSRSDRGPNPALCGEAYLSQSGDSLVVDTTGTTGTTRKAKAERKRSPAAGSRRKRRQH